MNNDARAARAIDQLRSLVSDMRLPRRARQMGSDVQQRLIAPVRLTVVGWAEADPVALVNGLLGGEVLPEADGVPPAELTHGSVDSWQLVDRLGETVQSDAAGLAACDLFSLALLRRAAPLPLLQHVAFRVVVLEGADDEVRQALRWSMRQADMLLWCTHVPGEDAPLWSAVPQALFDHSFLAVRTPGRCPLHQTGFLGTHAVPPAGQDIVAVQGLRTALFDHISRGRREDLDCAVGLLEQYLPRTAVRPRPAVQRAPDQTLHAPEQMPKNSPVSPRSEAMAMVSPQEAAPNARVASEPERVIDLLAERAREIEVQIDRHAGHRSSDTLETCATALADAASESAADPVLSEALSEAADLALLIQLEGSDTAFEDSLALMLQARHLCEEALCA